MRITISRFHSLFLLALLAVLFTVPTAQAADGKPDPGVMLTVPDPGSDLWRAVRQRDGEVTGKTQVKGVDSGILINYDGQIWREFRMDQLVPYSAYLLAGFIGAILLFRLLRGKMKIESGRSDQRILRFTVNQRTVHWITAILFLILGITGVVLLFGRFVVIPLIGPDAFGGVAYVCKRIHDFCGPAFGVALLFMIALFIKGNFPKWSDLQWFAKGGGMFGAHAHAGRYNAGEKSWFWIVVIVGSIVVVSGMVLDFPIFDQSRQTMEFYHIVHGISAVVILAVSFGHIYMGTAAMEGSYETMATGECDANWAREHHDLWYEEMKAQGKVYTAGSPASEPPGRTDKGRQAEA